RLLQDGGDEFLFAARDFRFLHFHLRFALDLLNPHGFFDHLLLHDVGFDFVGLVGRSLRFLCHFEVTGLFDVQVTLGFGLLGQRGGFGRDAFLISLCFGDGRRACRLGALDGNVAIGFGGGYFGVSLDASDIGTPHVGDVFVFVAHFLDGEADDFQPHLAHVIGAGGTHAVADHFRLLDDLLHGELADDSPEMALHHQANQGFALFWSLCQKLLSSGEDGLLVVFYFDLRNGFNGYGDALLGIQALLRGDVEGHQFQREIAAGLHHRKNQSAFSAVDLRASHAEANQRFIWPNFSIHLGDHDHDHQKPKNEKPGDDHHFVWQPEHKASFSTAPDCLYRTPVRETFYFVNSSHRFT